MVLTAPAGRWGTLIVALQADVAEVTLNDGSPASGYVAFQVDVGNDGFPGSEDLDGWRGHQDLPYDIRILPKLLSDDTMAFHDLP